MYVASDPRSALPQTNEEKTAAAPVAPALANALEDATSVRFRELPFTPDRIFAPIFEKHGDVPATADAVAIS